MWFFYQTKHKKSANVEYKNCDLVFTWQIDEIHCFIHQNFVSINVNTKSNYAVIVFCDNTFFRV